MPARRTTGKHGSAQKGDGRKRDVLPTDVSERLGKPPTDKPLLLSCWYSSALSELVWLYLATGKYVEMLREAKGTAGAMGRVMPLDIQLQAARLVKNDDDKLQEDEAPTRK